MKKILFVLLFTPVYQYAMDNCVPDSDLQDWDIINKLINDDTQNSENNLQHNEVSILADTKQENSNDIFDLPAFNFDNDLPYHSDNEQKESTANATNLSNNEQSNGQNVKKRQAQEETPFVSKRPKINVQTHIWRNILVINTNQPKENNLIPLNSQNAVIRTQVITNTASLNNTTNELDPLKHSLNCPYCTKVMKTGNLDSLYGLIENHFRTKHNITDDKQIRQLIGNYKKTLSKELISTCQEKKCKFYKVGHTQKEVLNALIKHYQAAHKDSLKDQNFNEIEKYVAFNE